jgi:hypothetical protein
MISRRYIRIGLFFSITSFAIGDLGTRLPKPVAAIELGFIIFPTVIVNLEGFMLDDMTGKMIVVIKQ